MWQRAYGVYPSGNYSLVSNPSKMTFLSGNYPKSPQSSGIKKYTFLNKKKVFSDKELSIHFENVILFYFY